MSGSLTPIGTGLIEWVAVGGSADGATTDTAGYALNDKTIFLANAGSGSITAGQRIKLNGDDNYYTMKYSVADVSGAGLATSSTTDATGYAIGAVSVALNAVGSGACLAGNIVNFAGDATNYTVTEGVSDVLLGGTITFTPALVSAIAAATTAVTCRNALTFPIGLRQVVTAGVTKRIYTGGELKRAGQTNLPISSTGVFSSLTPDDTTLAWFKEGQIAQLELNQSYSKLNVKMDDIINRSIASSGISQTTVIRQGELYDLGIKFIDDVRGQGAASDLESILSMFEGFDTGVLMAWFPDYAARPTEFYYCTLEKRGNPVRSGQLNWHGIDFTLRVETGTSVTVPTFGV